MMTSGMEKRTLWRIERMRELRKKVDRYLEEETSTVNKRKKGPNEANDCLIGTWKEGIDMMINLVEKGPAHNDSLSEIMYFMNVRGRNKDEDERSRFRELGHDFCQVLEYFVLAVHDWVTVKKEAVEEMENDRRAEKYVGSDYFLDEEFGEAIDDTVVWTAKQKPFDEIVADESDETEIDDENVEDRLSFVRADPDAGLICASSSGSDTVTALGQFEDDIAHSSFSPVLNLKSFNGREEPLMKEPRSQRHNELKGTFDAECIKSNEGSATQIPTTLIKLLSAPVQRPFSPVSDVKSTKSTPSSLQSRIGAILQAATQQRHPTHFKQHLAELHCSKCNATFLSKWKVVAHESNCTGKPEIKKKARFPCAYCTWTGSSKTYLKKHQRKEHKLKPYECNGCNANFEYAAELKLHKETVHL